mmetsp:Transcript_4036/g.9741  ORF Transcript_4036/g.9741 Transcript_4036/m.9741 type:complete len:313 (+) Transcript_4036:87-1025(+)
MAVALRRRVLPAAQPRARWFSTDSPWRAATPESVQARKWKKRTYGREVLIFADSKKLAEAAELVLSQPGATRPKAFWEVFEKRTVQSAHLLTPIQGAMIIRAFEDTGCLVDTTELVRALAMELPKREEELTGLAVRVLCDAFSRHDDEAAKQGVGALLRQVPNVMYQMSIDDLTAVLLAVRRAALSDSHLCATVALKARAHMPMLGFNSLSSLAAAYAEHDHRDVPFMQELASRGLETAESDSEDFPVALSQLLVAFHKLAIALEPTVMQRYKELVEVAIDRFTHEEARQVAEMLGEAGEMDLQRKVRAHAA